MPKLKDLTCSVEVASRSHPDIALHEYRTTYGDGSVETYICIPSSPKPFSICLTSSKFIAEGLAMFVYIDGVYQCNRNRLDLKSGSGDGNNDACVSFKVRQKEEKNKDGLVAAKQWLLGGEQRFNGSPSPRESAENDELGCIRVIVLRCAAAHPRLSCRFALDGADDDFSPVFGLDGHHDPFDDYSYDDRSPTYGYTSSGDSRPRPLYRSYQSPYTSNGQRRAERVSNLPYRMGQVPKVNPNINPSGQGPPPPPPGWEYGSTPVQPGSNTQAHYAGFPNGGFPNVGTGSTPWLEPLLTEAVKRGIEESKRTGSVLQSNDQVRAGHQPAGQFSERQAASQVPGAWPQSPGTFKLPYAQAQFNHAGGAPAQHFAWTPGVNPQTTTHGWGDIETSDSWYSDDRPGDKTKQNRSGWRDDRSGFDDEFEPGSLSSSPRSQRSPTDIRKSRSSSSHTRSRPFSRPRKHRTSKSEHKLYHVVDFRYRKAPRSTTSSSSSSSSDKGRDRRRSNATKHSASSRSSSNTVRPRASSRQYKVSRSHQRSRTRRHDDDRKSPRSHGQYDDRRTRRSKTSTTRSQTRESSPSSIGELSREKRRHSVSHRSSSAPTNPQPFTESLDEFVRHAKSVRESRASPHTLSSSTTAAREKKKGRHATRNKWDTSGDFETGWRDSDHDGKEKKKGWADGKETTNRWDTLEVKNDDGWGNNDSGGVNKDNGWVNDDWTDKDDVVSSMRVSRWGTKSEKFDRWAAASTRESSPAPTWPSDSPGWNGESPSKTSKDKKERSQKDKDSGKDTKLRRDTEPVKSSWETEPTTSRWDDEPITSRWDNGSAEPSKKSEKSHKRSEREGWDHEPHWDEASASTVKKHSSKHRKDGNVNKTGYASPGDKSTNSWNADDYAGPSTTSPRHGKSLSKYRHSSTSHRKNTPKSPTTKNLRKPYEHPVGRPAYKDTMSHPYAEFKFHYGSRDALERMFPGLKHEIAEQKERERKEEEKRGLLGLKKEKLAERVIQAEKELKREKEGGEPKAHGAGDKSGGKDFTSEWVQSQSQGASVRTETGKIKDGEKKREKDYKHESKREKISERKISATKNIW